MKATSGRFSKKDYNYTLVPISKEEMKRRGLTAHKLNGCSFLIALDYEKKPFRKSDNTTWGHVYKGGFIFGVCEKVYKNRDAYIIIEQPIEVMVSVKKSFDFYGNFTGYSRIGENKVYKNITSIANSNKALYGCKIGSAII